jgi:glycosyltransferase involved in cell wall biosynthesis
MNHDKNLSTNFLKKRRVLSNPVDIDHIQQSKPSLNEINHFKNQNNLNDFFIVGRIGRSADAKFDLITLDGFAKFAKGKENVRFLLVGQTPTILRHACKLGILDKIVIFNNTSELTLLLMYYSCIDVFLGASKIGESFGMVLAEAMCLGIPVITIDTPTKDNAQIEVVDNGVTGFVVPRLSYKISEAITKLYDDKELRNRFSISSQKKIYSNYYAQDIVDSLKDLILQHFALKSNIVADKVIEYNEELKNEYDINRKQINDNNVIFDLINLKYNSIIILLRKIINKFF